MFPSTSCSFRATIVDNPSRRSRISVFGVSHGQPIEILHRSKRHTMAIVDADLLSVAEARKVLLRLKHQSD
jgi:hypothetical protein